MDTVATQYGNDISALACPSVSLCVAADREGNTVTSTSPTGGAAAWQLQLVDAVPTLVSVWCGQGFACVAGDTGGNILTSPDPSAGSASWRPVHISDTTMGWVGCYPAGLCAAATGNGMLVSLDPTAGAWASVGGDAAQSTIGDCPTPNLCVELPTAIPAPTSLLVSDGPLAPRRPVVLTLPGSTYLQAQAVSCASAHLCVSPVTDYVLAGNAYWPRRALIATTTSPGVPGSWTVDPQPAPTLNAISCPAVTLCVGPASGHQVAFTTDPAAGTRSWHVSRAPAPLTWITCPSPGASTVLVRASRRATIAVPLNAAARRRLRRQHVLRLALTITSIGKRTNVLSRQTYIARTDRHRR